MFPRMTGDPIYEASTGVPLGLLHMSQGDVVGASNSEVAERVQRESAMQVMLDDLAQLDATEFEDLLGNRDPEQALLDEMDTMQLDNTPRSIITQENWALCKFNEVLQMKNYPCNLETAGVQQMVTALRIFYAFIRKLDGGYYAPASLITARAGVYRYLMRTRGINIIEDKNFAKANLQLKATAAMFIKEGGSVMRFCALETVDLEKLRVYFDRSNPTKLQHEMYYVLAVHFGLRGREWFRKLTTDSLIGCTINGRRAFRLASMESKNVRGSLETRSAEDRKQSVLVETRESGCPYQCVELYLRKIKESKREEGMANSELFLRPRVRGLSGSWYFAKQVVGVNTLGNMMRDISKSANLSKEYTGQCLRVTVATELKASGASLHDIGAVTGHKSDTATARYIRGNRKRDAEMAELSTKISAMGAPAADTAESRCVASETVESGARFVVQQQEPAMVRQGMDLQMLASAISGTFNHCEFHVHVSGRP